jgi:SAM-dependent methyltransferase
MQFASAERGGRDRARVLDVGCGAARNAVPLALDGWEVVGTDASWPMLEAAARRRESHGLAGRLHLAQATMAELPVGDGIADLIVAHGIWNLAPSCTEFRAAVREAARAGRSGAALFVFTFSRHTLPEQVAPVPGEPFVFTQFSGSPQCFLTRDQLLDELAAAGFHPDPGVPLRELNRPTGILRPPGGPVIWEGTFRLA